MNNFLRLKDSIKLYIASKILKKEKEEISFDFKATEEMERIAIEYLNGKPLSKIFNEKYFWTHSFYTNQYTLDPRPSTERIIEVFLKKHKKEEEFTFLDLGTGTGAICGTLLGLFPNAKCVAIDISGQALQVAKLNLERLGVSNRCEIVQNDWLENINSYFNMLVSNPPYLSLEEYNQNKNILQYDPFISLVSEDPLRMYRRIAEKEYLFNEIYLEIPPKRQKEIRKLFKKTVFLCY
jgi:release factor glutamine methyltransferase